MIKTALCILVLGLSCNHGHVLAQTQDNAAYEPIVKIAPKYPVQAARDGLEGYVVLTFTVDVNGSVKNARVTESVPERVFDREALKAVASYKYTPRLVNGVAVEVPDMKTTLTFQLN